MIKVTVLLTCIAISLPVFNAAAVDDLESFMKENDRAENIFRNEQEQFLIGDRLAGSESFEVLAINPFCVKTPLPTTPSGMVWKRRFSKGTTAFDLLAWRIGCTNAQSNVLIKIIPVSASPFICSSSFTVIQKNDQYGWKLTSAPNGSSFCDDLLIPKTFLMEQWSFDQHFDEDLAFTIVWDSDSTQRLSLGSYNNIPSGCPQGAIGKFSPTTGIMTIPNVQYPNGKCYSFDMKRIAPFTNLNFNVFKQTLVK